VISYSPVFLKDLNFLLVPKMFRSAQELLGDKTIESVDDIVKRIEIANIKNTSISATSVSSRLSAFE